MKKMNNLKVITLFFLLILLIVFIVLKINGEDITDKIIPQEEIIKMQNKTGKIYILDLHKGKKHLIFYGVVHSFDPSNSMFEDIEKTFKDLNPQIAFNEGGDVPAYTNRITAIKESGDPGFMGYLGWKYNIPVKNVEQSSEKEFNYLLSKYKMDDVLLMYLLRQVPQYQRGYKYDNRDFDSYMEHLMYNLRNEGFPAKKEEMSIEHLKLIYKEYFNEELSWEIFNFSIIAQTIHGRELIKIMYDITDFRDRHIVKLLVKNLKKYDRIFITLGGDHAIKTEPALKTYFE